MWTEEKQRTTRGFAIVGLDGKSMNICNAILLQFQLDEYRQAFVLNINNKTKPSSSSGLTEF